MSTNHEREIRCHRGRHRGERAQSFSSEDKAKAYALKEGIKSFDVVRLRSGLSKKMIIVPKIS